MDLWRTGTTPVARFFEDAPDGPGPADGFLSPVDVVPERTLSQLVGDPSFPDNGGRRTSPRPVGLTTSLVRWRVGNGGRG